MNHDGDCKNDRMPIPCGCVTRALAAKEQIIEKLTNDLQDWRTSYMAAGAGHLLRCAKINGVWSCAKECAVRRADNAEREIDRLKADLAARESPVTLSVSADDEAKTVAGLQAELDSWIETLRKKEDAYEVLEREQAVDRAAMLRLALHHNREDCDYRGGTAEDCPVARAAIQRARGEGK